MATKKTGSLKGVDVVLVTSVNLAADVGASVLPVANGGTGTGTWTDGQIAIGNTTGNTLVKTTLTGTSNQVVVTNGAGAITLSLPQSIATTSSPTFAALTVNGKINGVTNGTATGEALTFDAIGVSAQAYDAELAAIAALSSSGLIARTGAGTAEARTITLGLSLSGSNLDGVSGNPTIDAIQDIRTGAFPQFAGLGLGMANAVRLQVGASGAGSQDEVINLFSGATGRPFIRIGQNGATTAILGVANGTNSLIAGTVSGSTALRGAADLWLSGDAGVTGVVILSGGSVGVYDGGNLIVGGTTGTKLATSATAQKISLFNATPIVQPTAAGQAALAAQGQQTLTDSTAGTAGTALAAVTGAVYATDVATIRDWIASLAAQLALVKTDVANLRTLVDAQRSAMVNFGSMKGS
jgi:hypothetical protein